mgnify:CR=1 FL=1
MDQNNEIKFAKLPASVLLQPQGPGINSRYDIVPENHIFYDDANKKWMIQGVPGLFLTEQEASNHLAQVHHARQAQ